MDVAPCSAIAPAATGVGTCAAVVAGVPVDVNDRPQFEQLPGQPID